MSLISLRSMNLWTSSVMMGLTVNWKHTTVIEKGVASSKMYVVVIVIACLRSLSSRCACGSVLGKLNQV